MNDAPCTSQPIASCKGCNLNGRLMCRFEKSDLTQFLIIFLPFFVTAIGGVIVGGYGWWLFGWLAYAIFFFSVWEARVLCSHCPYWAEEGRILKCHANYGIIKLWRYHPEPMNRFEQIQFIVGSLLLVFIPEALMLLGHEYLFALIGLTCSITFGYLLWRNICDRCVNISCPLNHVPQETRQAFLDRNPLIAETWEANSRNIK